MPRGLSGFLAERIFGPECRELLAQDLVETDTRAETARVDRMASLRKTLMDVGGRGAADAPLETQDDPDGSLFARVRDRVARLAREERQRREELRARRLRSLRSRSWSPNSWTILPRRPLSVARCSIQFCGRSSSRCGCRSATTANAQGHRRQAARRSSCGRHEGSGERDQRGRARFRPFPCSWVPPAGFEPAPTPPEGAALSPELRGQAVEACRWCETTLAHRRGGSGRLSARAAARPAL